MTLDQLECFMVLAQRLSYTQAANDLFMAQPALSRIIVSLEKELDVQLFFRNSRNVSLTPAGVAFYRECPSILDSYKKSILAAKMAQKGLHGTIAVGLLRDNVDVHIIDLVKAMRDKYPEIHIILRECSHSQLIRSFSTGEIDAMINTGIWEDNSDLGSIILRYERQCVVVPLDFKYKDKKELRMEQLRDEDFIVMSRAASQPGYDLLMRMAAQAGFTPKIVATANYVPGLLMMVACGMGITTLTDHLKYMAQERVCFIPLEGVPISHHSMVWYKANSNPSLPFLLETARLIAPEEQLNESVQKALVNTLT